MAEEGAGEPPMFSLVTSTDPLRHKLWQARQDGNFSDFQIAVDDVRIPCHKLILSAQSEYFSCMLQHENTVEVTQGFVDLQLLDVDAVKLVVDFMYSGRIEFEFHVVQAVIKVLDRFQLTENTLHEKISDYIIPHLYPDNCLGWFKFGEQMNFEKIKSEAQSIILQRLIEVSKSSEFVSLSFNALSDYMQKAMKSHYNHDQSLKAFVAWVIHDVGKRSEKFGDILQIVNLNKCSADALKEIYEKHGTTLLNNFDLLQQFTAAVVHSTPKSRDIIVAGGRMESNVYNRRTWIVNLETGSSVPKVSQTRDACSAAMCASPDGLICAGGTPTNHIQDLTTKCDLYHKNTDTWIDLPSLPAPTGGAGATCVKDTLLMVVGGWEDGKNKAVCIDLRTRRSWTICKGLLQALGYPIVCSVDECVFVILSTINANEKVRNGSEISVQCYDTTTSTWAFRSPLPDGIGDTRGARALTLAGLLYLVGGRGRLCASYNPICDTWTILAPPQYSHMYGAALVANGKVILSGGKDVKDQKIQDNIEEYDPTTDTWRLLSVKLPVPLFDHCMILR